MKLLMEYFKKNGSEYEISTSTGVVCFSDNFNEIKNSKCVSINMHYYGDKYYYKMLEKLNVDEVIYTICEYKDVTKYAKEIMTSKIDCLTKLPNRTQIEKSLSAINNECVIVMSDIDDFKNINDIYGHQTGDEVIRLLGNLIRNSLGDDDFAGRYGGEEFLIIFDTSDVNKVKNKMDEFNELLNKITKELKISVSIGIHKFDPKVESISSAIKKADKALYHVKHTGKNASMIYEDIINKKGTTGKLNN